MNLLQNTKAPIKHLVFQGLMFTLHPNSWSIRQLSGFKKTVIKDMTRGKCQSKQQWEQCSLSPRPETCLSFREGDLNLHQHQIFALCFIFPSNCEICLDAVAFRLSCWQTPLTSFPFSCNKEQHYSWCTVHKHSVPYAGLSSLASINITIHRIIQNIRQVWLCIAS